MKKLTLALLTILSTTAAQAQNERIYNDAFCERMHGISEFHSPAQNVRIDCITEDMVFETDYAHKWYEGFAQALYYSRISGKKAGILLILRKPSDIKFWNRLNDLIWYYDVPVKTYSVRAY